MTVLDCNKGRVERRMAKAEESMSRAQEVRGKIIPCPSQQELQGLKSDQEAVYLQKVVVRLELTTRGWMLCLL